MKIIHAELSAAYSGRGYSTLPKADRILMIKNDNSVSIHSDKGYKPLNYMNPPLDLTIEQNGSLLIFKSPKEELAVTLHKVYSNSNFDLVPIEPGLIKEGTELQLQKWLSKNIEVLNSDYTFVQREFETGAGPVDILARDSDGKMILVEVKRWANMNSIGQIRRYVDAFKKNNVTDVKGVLASVQFNSAALKLAEQNNIDCLTIPIDWNGKTIDEPKKVISLLDFS